MPKLGYRKPNAKPRTVRERAYDATRKKARAERNRKRQAAIKKGRVRVGDGKVINHKSPIKNGLAKAKKGGTTVQSQKQSDKSGSRIRDGKNRVTKPRKK